MAASSLLWTAPTAPETKPASRLAPLGPAVGRSRPSRELSTLTSNILLVHSVPADPAVALTGAMVIPGLSRCSQGLLDSNPGSLRRNPSGSAPRLFLLSRLIGWASGSLRTARLALRLALHLPSRGRSCRCITAKRPNWLCVVLHLTDCWVSSSHRMTQISRIKTAMSDGHPRHPQCYI